MNAVNLIPREGRRRGAGTSVSVPTLALAGVLLVALIAAVLYVTTANTVATRKSELAQVSAGVAGWTAAANSYASFVQAAQRRTQELADVRQLASSRFPWSNLLGQIGGLMPKAAALSSLTAGTSASTTSSTPSTPSTSGASVPSVQLAGCAASQSVVAQTMVQLRRVSGVSAVTLSSSSDAGAPSGSGSGSSSNSGCPFPVQFQLSLTFTPSAAAAAAATATSGSATSPATTTSTAVASQ
jgi:Tfp pilus assembly protein PilN